MRQHGHFRDATMQKANEKRTKEKDLLSTLIAAKMAARTCSIETMSNNLKRNTFSFSVFPLVMRIDTTLANERLGDSHGFELGAHPQLGEVVGTASYLAVTVPIIKLTGTRCFLSGVHRPWNAYAITSPARRRLCICDPAWEKSWPRHARKTRDRAQSLSCAFVTSVCVRNTLVRTGSDFESSNVASLSRDRIETTRRQNQC